MPGSRSLTTAAPRRPNGHGYAMRWLCAGCKQQRTTTAGSRGKGTAKRCAQCVQAKAQKQAQAEGASE